MYRLRVVNIDEYVFTLQDSEDNFYKKVIEFMNTKYVPKVGDYISLPESILEKDNIYVYGDIYDKEKDDIIKIEQDKNIIYLQRYYG